MSAGSLAGYPVVDVKCTLLDGSYHDVDSSVLAFQIAARQAFRNAMPKCGVQLLEPVMKVGSIPWGATAEESHWMSAPEVSTPQKGVSECDA